MKKIIIPAIAILLATTYGCQKNQAEKSNQISAAEKSIAVKASPLQLKKFPEKLSFSGSIESWEKIHLVPAAPGKIEKINVEVSSAVSQGDLIAIMDQTQLLSTKLQLEQLEKDFHRIDSLSKIGAVSQQQFEQLKTNYEVTQKNYSFMEKNVYLKSPISGIVTEKYYNEGEMFSAAPNTKVGKAALVAIENLSTMKLLVDIPESYYSRISKGLPIMVEVSALNKKFPARINLIHPAIDPLSKTFKVEIAVSNPNYEIKPGMFATAEITFGEKEAFVVPTTSLLKQQGTAQYYVFRYNNGVAEQIFVNYNIIDNTYIEINSDQLKENDLILSIGIEKVVDGSKVTLAQ
ncbi:MAG TPA: efflux RND transporter periplasmic adaptor subunit [Salinivirgaceae bacterium]|nr:efflux RND transporter periplasmic adaptor subunit [Salinivirgaceae bacterium]